MHRCIRVCLCGGNAVGEKHLGGLCEGDACGCGGCVCSISDAFQTMGGSPLPGRIRCFVPVTPFSAGTYAIGRARTFHQAAKIAYGEVVVKALPKSKVEAAKMTENPGKHLFR